MADATEKHSTSHVGRDRQYCVQYRESDLNFVQRLLEEEGIYYFFTHELGKHTMVLADSTAAHEEKAHKHDDVVYTREELDNMALGEHWWALTTSGSIYPGKYTVLRGYDHTLKRKTPVPDAQVADQLAEDPSPGEDFEDYDSSLPPDPNRPQTSHRRPTDRRGRRRGGSRR